MEPIHQLKALRSMVIRSSGAVPASRNTTSELSDYASSPLRWTYDILLTEFNGLRLEFQTLLQSVERTYGYMFAAVGAIIASQIISNPAIRTLDRHPTYYLLVALIAMWFPINNLILAVALTSGGAYIRDVLAPKINHVVELATKVSSESSGVNVDDLIGWKSDVAELLGNESRNAVRAPMSWDNFDPLLRYLTKGRRLLLIIMYVLRSSLLYAPAALLVTRFFVLSSHLSSVQIILLVVLCAVACLNTAALSSLSNQVSFGQRRGPFRNRA